MENKAKILMWLNEDFMPMEKKYDDNYIIKSDAHSITLTKQEPNNAGIGQTSLKYISTMCEHYKASFIITGVNNQIEIVIT